MKEDTIYQVFMQWAGKTWWELPDSEHLLPMIKANYTPDQAAFLTGFPPSSTTLEDLATLKEMSPEKIEPLLEGLGRQGMIYKSRRGNSVRYRFNDTFFALLRARFWPGKEDEGTAETAAAVNNYVLDNWLDQYQQVHHKGLRTLPIEKTIQDPRTILPYEDVIKIVEDFEYYTVSTCPCRHRHNLDPSVPDCPHPTETCLHFDELGQYIVEHALGREITKAETLEILKKAADAGLVHGVSNWKHQPDTICNCCSCCCMFLESYHKLGHDRSLDRSNYYVVVNLETCKACGLCIKRYPMDALQLKHSPHATNKYAKAVTVDTEICLGCGVCIHKCPTQSLTLKRKEKTHEPPEDVRDYMQRYMADRRAAGKGTT